MSEILHKAFTPTDFSLSEQGEVLVAFARLNNIDEDGHVTLPGAIPTKVVPMSDYAHSSWPQKGGRLPVGKGEVSESGDLGIFRGNFFLKTDQGRNAYETVKEMGDIQEWSYGYEILEAREVPNPGDPQGKAIGLGSLDIFEVSPVLLGAAGRGNTATLALKELAGDPSQVLPSEAAGLLLAGVPLVDHTGRLLSEIEGWKERISDLRDLRVKEGRVLSTQNRDRIRNVADALEQVEEIRRGLLSLLDETDPEKKEEAAKALLGQYLRTQARIAGVQIDAGGQQQ